jgi:hypothetical protein
MFGDSKRLIWKYLTKSLEMFAGRLGLRPGGGGMRSNLPIQKREKAA